MLAWLIAGVAGVSAAALSYGAGVRLPGTLALGVLRAVAGALIVALLLDAPAGHVTVPAPWVALDASASVTRGKRHPDACWHAHADSARAAGRAVFRFGDSLRADPAEAAPADRQSSVRSVADRALGGDGPVVVVTDGELDDADVVPGLPGGSRILVIDCASVPDMALASLDAPRSLGAGDTVTVRTTVVAGPAGGPPGSVTLLLDDLILARAPVAAMASFGEQPLELRGVPGGPDRAALLRVVYRGAGDDEPRNDTLTLGVEVTHAPAAVFVSTLPDFDAREAVAALRGVTSLPTRAWYRVAPGAWRAEGTLAPVSESAVRAAVASAPVVVMHGDTSVFGSPRTATRGSLLLFAPPGGDEGEWFATSPPASPMASGLGALPLDSLPPVEVAPSGAMPRGQWTGLTARRGGPTGETRAALVGWDEPRHIAVLGASGFWRWRFRGGVREQGYQALFGTLFDWLAAGRTDPRGAVPDGRLLRAGMPVVWQRGVSADSVAQVTLRRRGATARVQTFTLHFDGGAPVAESPALPPGIYDAGVPRGTVVLAVNNSRELVPRRPTVRSAAVGRRTTARPSAALRDVGWIYLLAVAALSAEWIGRRRAGLG